MFLVLFAFAIYLMQVQFMSVQSHTFRVRLYCFSEKPEIVLEPTDVDVQFGTTEYLTCRAVGDLKPGPPVLQANALPTELGRNLLGRRYLK